MFSLLWWEPASLIVKTIGLYFCNLHYVNSGYVFTFILYYLGFVIGKIKYWIEIELNFLYFSYRMSSITAP